MNSGVLSSIAWNWSYVTSFCGFLDGPAAA
jgi:hypothetical protein